MADLAPLGRARRARGVDHIGEARGRHVGTSQDGGFGVRLGVDVLERQAGRPTGDIGESRQQAPRPYHGRRRRVRQQQRQPLARVGGVERQVDATPPQGAQRCPPPPPASARRRAPPARRSRPPAAGGAGRSRRSAGRARRSSLFSSGSSGPPPTTRRPRRAAPSPAPRTGGARGGAGSPTPCRSTPRRAGGARAPRGAAGWRAAAPAMSAMLPPRRRAFRSGREGAPRPSR